MAKTTKKTTATPPVAMKLTKRQSAPPSPRTWNVPLPSAARPLDPNTWPNLPEQATPERLEQNEDTVLDAANTGFVAERTLSPLATGGELRPLTGGSPWDDLTPPRPFRERPLTIEEECDLQDQRNARARARQLQQFERNQSFESSEDGSVIYDHNATQWTAIENGIHELPDAGQPFLMRYSNPATGEKSRLHYSPAPNTLSEDGLFVFPPGCKFFFYLLKLNNILVKPEGDLLTQALAYATAFYEFKTKETKRLEVDLLRGNFGVSIQGYDTVTSIVNHEIGPAGNHSAQARRVAGQARAD